MTAFFRLYIRQIGANSFEAIQMLEGTWNSLGLNPNSLVTVLIRRTIQIYVKSELNCSNRLVPGSDWLVLLSYFRLLLLAFRAHCGVISTTF